MIGKRGGEEMERRRDYGMDNLRGILILLVVFAHLLEICKPFPGSVFLYRTIYAFHMPAFLFLNGYFAKFDSKRILWNYLVPYVVFQTVYLFFDGWLNRAVTELQFTKPYWLLWYLLVCLFYHLLLPLYTVKSRRQRILALGITFGLSLLAGYAEVLGYQLSMSRFFVFQPWFLLGYYSRKEKLLARMSGMDEIRKRFLQGLFAVAVCVLPLLMHLVRFPYGILYGSCSYEVLNYGPWERLFAGATALAWIGFGLLVLKPLLHWPLPMLTALGQNTMSVFLLHGFVVRYIRHCQSGMLDTPMMVGLVTVLILACCGNPMVGKAFRSLFSGKPILQK